MKIIEFFGVPGAGKSTETVNLCQELIVNNKKCVLLRNNAYANFPVINHRKYMFYLLKPKNLLDICIFCIRNVFYEGKNFYLGNFQDRLKVLLRQLMYVEIYTDQKLAKKFDVLISDQGLVQEITGYFLEKNTSDYWLEFFLKKLIKTKNKIVFTYLEREIDVALRNIENRKRKSTAMDFYTPSNLALYLSMYKTSFDKIIEEQVNLKHSSIHFEIWSTKKGDKL